MTEPYNNGGVIPGESTPVKIDIGERIIRNDGTVLELRRDGDECRWHVIGRVDLSNYRLTLERLNACPCCGETGQHADQCLEKQER